LDKYKDLIAFKTAITASVSDHRALATAKHFSYLSACDKIIFTEGQVWNYVQKIGLLFYYCLQEHFQITTTFLTRCRVSKT